LFGRKLVYYTRSVEESKQLNGRKEPCIIISASGMCENGRILHHLKHNIENSANTILIIGYQAPDTVGYRLVQRQPKIRIFDGMYSLRAEVVVMNGFSSHADQGDFMDFLGPLAGQVGKVRLVHGEVEQAEALAKNLRDKGFKDVVIPARGEKVVVSS
jgi:metallo-beta-lactamase family protein